MASRDKGLHSSPPAPSASPPRPQGTTDMGLLGISSFRDMPASLFVSSVCLWLLLLSGVCVADRTGRLVKTSSLPYLGTFCLQGPLHISPKFNQLSKETRVPTGGIQEQPLTP